MLLMSVRDSRRRGYPANKNESQKKEEPSGHKREEMITQIRHCCCRSYLLMRRETNDGRARGPSSDKYLQRRSPAAPSLTRVDPDEHDRQMENPPSPPCPCLTRRARVRELWTKIHIHHIPFSGSTISHPHPSRSLLWPCLVILLPPSHLHPRPSPHPPTPTSSYPQSHPAAGQTAECPRTPAQVMSGARETSDAGLGVPGPGPCHPPSLPVRALGPRFHPHHHGAATGFSNSGRCLLGA